MCTSSSVANLTNPNPFSDNGYECTLFTVSDPCCPLQPLLLYTCPTLSGPTTMMSKFLVYVYNAYTEYDHLDGRVNDGKVKYHSRVM